MLNLVLQKNLDNLSPDLRERAVFLLEAYKVSPPEYIKEIRVCIVKLLLEYINNK